MKKHIAKFSMLTLCAAAILAVPALSLAQDNTNAPALPAVAPPVAVAQTPPVPAVQTPPAPAAQTPPVKKHRTTLPFHGTLTAVDTNAMTLTVGKRAFEMTSETIVTKDGKPAELADGVVGETVRGAYKKNAEGKLDAVTIHYGGKTAGTGGQLITANLSVNQRLALSPAVFYCRFHQLVSPFDFCGDVCGNWDCCRSSRLRAASRAMMNSS